MKRNLYHHIIQDRQKVILDSMRKKDLGRIERELALLVLDILHALQIKSISLQDSCRCFRRVGYSLDPKVEARLSEEVQDLINEGMILDEIGTRYGPNVATMFALATDILQKDKKFFQSKTRISAISVPLS